METLLATPESTLLRAVSGRLVFENERSGWKVLRAQVDGLGDVTLTGVFPDVGLGTEIECEGAWEKHPKHGLNFRVDGVRICVPTTVAGIEAYLGSGLIKGVGKATAKRVVKWFGERTLEVIKHESGKLKYVPRLSGKAAQALVRGVRDHGEVESLMMWLTKHGLSATLASRIHTAFGSEALALVNRNPYCLTDIDGVGFLTADAAAIKLGMARDSIERVRAAVLYALDLAGSREGSTGLPEELLLNRTGELLGAEVPDLIREGIDWLVSDGKCVRRELGERRLLQPSKTAAQEDRLSKALTEMVNQQSPSAQAQDEALRRARQSELACGITLDDSQRDAVIGILLNRVAIMVGGPGTGKTSTLKVALHALQDAGCAPTLAAPTGKAARRMAQATGIPASTLHSLILHGRRQGAAAPEIAALCIDEASMLDLSLAVMMLALLGSQSRLILVGDPRQLPSVGPGAVLRDLIDSGRFATFRLTTIHRQARDSSIVLNAHAMIEGRPRDMVFGDDFRYFAVDDEATAAQRTLQTVAILRRRGVDVVADAQILCSGHRGAAGDHALNAALQAQLNPGPAAEVSCGSVLLRLGDKVIACRNDYNIGSEGLRNGSIGRIIAVDAGAGSLSVRFDTEGDIAFTREQLPLLQLAYAITTHRSQGSEFEHVIVPLVTSHYTLLSRNLVYTAVTRARKAVYLIGQGKALHLALNKTVDASRTTGMLAALRTSPVTAADRPPPN